MSEEDAQKVPEPGTQFIDVEEITVSALYLEGLFDGHPISAATGFVVTSPRGPVLCTNWHVVAGRNAFTGQILSDKGAIPNQLRIHHRSPTGATVNVPRVEPLSDDDQPRWIEHPKWRQRVDAVALPLTQIDDKLTLHPVSIDPVPDENAIDLEVTTPVSIIGYPFGMNTAGVLPIWATGFVASEPSSPEPYIFIDARTRPGQSGSPVVLHRKAGAIKTRVVGGSLQYRTASTNITQFVGIYSGRYHPESDLGFVWRASALREIIANAG